MSHDNEGRRFSLRSALVNDPLYRRIKDAMLLLLAIRAMMSTSAMDSAMSLFGKEPEVQQETKIKIPPKIWEHISESDKRFATLEQKLANIESNQNDMKQDVRELLRQVGNLRR